MLQLTDLKVASMVSVHFVLPNELISDDLNSLGAGVFEASIADVNDDKDLFAVISNAMHFPDYFGHNWDALDECLGDMDWLPANVLRNAAKPWCQCLYVLGKGWFVRWEIGN